MADEVVGVLQELSSLLRRLTEQNEAEFKQGLLEEIQRHNQLLEALIGKMGRQ